MQADTLGSIRVSIERVNQCRLRAPVARSAEYNSSMTTDVAKEIFKDRNISHAMK